MIYRDHRQCPHCGGSLARVRTQSYSYERCERCRGLYISEPVVSLMARSIQADADLEFTPIPARNPRSCPDCRQTMEAAALFDIPIDRCSKPEHGIWFDKDELTHVLERIGDQDPPPPPLPTSFASLLRDFFEGR